LVKGVLLAVLAFFFVVPLVPWMGSFIDTFLLPSSRNDSIVQLEPLIFSPFFPFFFFLFFPFFWFFQKWSEFHSTFTPVFSSFCLCVPAYFFFLFFFSPFHLSSHTFSLGIDVGESELFPPHLLFTSVVTHDTMVIISFLFSLDIK